MKIFIREPFFLLFQLVSSNRCDIAKITMVVAIDKSDSCVCSGRCPIDLSLVYLFFFSIFISLWVIYLTDFILGNVPNKWHDIRKLKGFFFYLVILCPVWFRILVIDYRILYKHIFPKQNFKLKRDPLKKQTRVRKWYESIHLSQYGQYDHRTIMDHVNRSLIRTKISLLIWNSPNYPHHWIFTQLPRHHNTVTQSPHWDFPTKSARL